MVRGAPRHARRGPIGAALALIAILGAALPAGLLAQSGSPRQPLRLGWVLAGGVQQLPLYAAEGFLADEGLDLQVVSLSSGSRVMAALAAGSVDVTMSSLEAVITAIGAGQPIRVFYAPRTAVGFTWYARPGINDWSDLKGGTILISSFGSMTDIITRFVLKRHGLNPGADVNVVQVTESAVRLAALQARRADVAAISPPLNLTAEEMGFRLLATQQAAIGELWPQAVFAARERVLTEQAGPLRALLRAFVRGTRRARAEREASVELLMARVKFSRVQAERIYDEVLPTLDERGDLAPAAMTGFWRMMMAAGEVTEPWPEARFLDRRFIDSFAQWVPPR